MKRFPPQTQEDARALDRAVPPQPYLKEWDERIVKLQQENARLRREATATVASIRTRVGQIEKSCSTWTADSIYQIERATGALRVAALDLHNALDEQEA